MISVLELAYKFEKHSQVFPDILDRNPDYMDPAKSPEHTKSIDELIDSAKNNLSVLEENISKILHYLADSDVAPDEAAHYENKFDATTHEISKLIEDLSQDVEQRTVAASKVFQLAKKFAQDEQPWDEGDGDWGIQNEFSGSIYEEAMLSGSPEILAELSKHHNDEVRANVAGNAATPAEVLKELSKDDNTKVRRKVAGNLSTPPEVLKELSKDDSKWVRIAVAGNQSASSETLAELSKDNDMGVIYILSANPSTPPEVLAGLPEDIKAWMEASPNEVAPDIKIESAAKVFQLANHFKKTGK